MNLVVMRSEGKKQAVNKPWKSSQMSKKKKGCNGSRAGLSPGGGGKY